MNAESWVGKRVVVGICSPASMADWYGHVSGFVTAESEDMVRVRGWFVHGWHHKEHCRILREANDA